MPLLIPVSEIPRPPLILWHQAQALLKDLPINGLIAESLRFTTVEHPVNHT